MAEVDRLRIGVVHSAYSSAQPSGENQVVDQQVQALRAAGHSVALCTRRTDDHSRRRTYPVRAALTVATGHGPDPVARLREFRPDVVMVNNLFPNYGRSWVRRWEGPLVAVMHNYRPLCPPGTFYRDGAVCTDCLDARRATPAVRHGCYRGSRMATLPLAVSTRFGADPLLSRADTVIVLNHTMGRLYEQAGVDPGRIRRVPNFLSRPASAGPGGNRWLFVGRLTEEKGILSLMREWPAGAPLDIVGSGPLEEVVARARPSDVTLLGQQPPERVSELMRHARGLVFPSRWFEGFPMVYLEALAAGTPVVAWKPSVVAEMVRDEQTGVVVGDLERTLQEAEESFPTMRDHCRAVFEEFYTRAAWVASMDGVFDRLRTAG